MLRSGGQATVIGMIPVGTMVEIHGPELLMEKKLTGSNMGSNQFRTDMPRFSTCTSTAGCTLDEMVSKTIGLEADQRGLRGHEGGQRRTERRHFPGQGRYATLSNSASWSPPGSTTSPVLRIFTRAMMPRMTVTYSTGAPAAAGLSSRFSPGVVLDEHREVPDGVQPHRDDQGAGEAAGDVVHQPDGEGEHHLLQGAAHTFPEKPCWARGVGRR